MRSTLFIWIVFLLTSACSQEVAGIEEPAQPLVDPAHRAVRIETTACGFATPRTGSGVVVDAGLVLTAAHLVIQADGILVTVEDGGTAFAVVTAIDPELDMALLRLPSPALPPVELSSVEAGATGSIVEGATSGTVAFEIEKVVSLSIEEVLGTERHARLGYELKAATTTGDSGAGAYDDTGRLIGIVFATSEDGESTWVTASAEIGDFLSAHDADSTEIVCDPNKSRLDLS